MSRLTKSAKLKDCQIRIPGVCNFNPETTVLAHLGGAGTALKKKDLHGAFACNACHDLVDGRTNSKVFSKVELMLMHYQGVERTHDIWINDELVSWLGQ